MLRCIIGKKIFVKGIVLCAMLFCVPLWCMKQKSVKKRTKDEKILVQEQKLVASSFLTEEIVHNRILPYLSLLELSRLGRTCKEYQLHCNIEKIITSPAKKSINFCYYDALTIALAHCAFKSEKEKFKRLWDCDQQVRDWDIQRYYGKLVNLPLEQKMEIYKKHYCNTYKRDKRWREQITQAIFDKDFDVLSVILHNKKCNVFKLNINEYTAFTNLCSIPWNDDNIDVLLALLPDEDKSNALEYLRAHGTEKLLSLLQKRNYCYQYNKKPSDKQSNNQCESRHRPSTRTSTLRPGGGPPKI